MRNTRTCNSQFTFSESELSSLYDKAEINAGVWFNLYTYIIYIYTHTHILCEGKKIPEKTDVPFNHRKTTGVSNKNTDGWNPFEVQLPVLRMLLLPNCQSLLEYRCF